MIRKLLGLEKDEVTCNALVDGEVCGREAWGWTLGKTHRYCEHHVPDEAVPYGGFEVEFADDRPTDSY